MPCRKFGDKIIKNQNPTSNPWRKSVKEVATLPNGEQIAEAISWRGNEPTDTAYMIPIGGQWTPVAYGSNNEWNRIFNTYKTKDSRFREFDAKPKIRDNRFIKPDSAQKKQ